jgi:O-antigen/teichoic acid export membrane protein
MNGALVVISALIVSFFNLGVLAYAALYTVSGLCLLVYSALTITPKYGLPKFSLDKDIWKKIRVGGIPLGIISVFMYLYFKIDIQIIDMMIGPIGVAYYSAAFKLIEALIFIPSMYFAAILPVVSAYHHEKNHELDRVVVGSLKYLYAVALPLTLFIVLLSGDVISLLYGAKYAQSIPVLQLLAVGMGIIYINYVPGGVLVAIGEKAPVIKANVVCTIFNILANIVLIPIYGIVGSAFAMIITQALNCGMLYVAMRRAGHTYPTKEMWNITVCALLSSGVVVALKLLGFPLQFIIPAMALSYIGALLAFDTISLNELKKLVGANKDV